MFKSGQDLSTTSFLVQGAAPITQVHVDNSPQREVAATGSGKEPSPAPARSARRQRQQKPRTVPFGQDGSRDRATWSWYGWGRGLSSWLPGPMASWAGGRQRWFNAA